MTIVRSVDLSVAMPWGTVGKAPRIMTLDTGLSSEIRYKLRQLYPKKRYTNNDIPDTNDNIPDTNNNIPDTNNDITDTTARLV